MSQLNELLEKIPPLKTRYRWENVADVCVLEWADVSYEFSDTIPRVVLYFSRERMKDYEVSWDLKLFLSRVDAGYLEEIGVQIGSSN